MILEVDAPIRCLAPCLLLVPVRAVSILPGARPTMAVAAIIAHNHPSGNTAPKGCLTSASKDAVALFDVGVLP